MSQGKYNEQAAREPAQLDRMRDLAARGVCAFCPEKLRTETTSAIEFETRHWVVKKNDFPYERTKFHLLLIPKAHVSTVSGLTASARAEFMEAVARVEREFKLASFAVAMRSGDMRYNGGSVEHLHGHVIVGDPQDPNPEPVRFKVSSRPV